MSTDDLQRENDELRARLAGILFSGALDNVTCGDLRRWRDEWKAKLGQPNREPMTASDFRLLSESQKYGAYAEAVRSFGPFAIGCRTCGRVNPPACLQPGCPTMGPL